MRIFLLLSLLILIGCVGYNDSSDVGYYLPQPIHKMNTIDTIWVNQQCCPSDDLKAPLKDYNTGEYYYPIYGSDNKYMDTHGKMYQTYPTY